MGWLVCCLCYKCPVTLAPMSQDHRCWRSWVYQFFCSTKITFGKLVDLSLVYLWRFCLHVNASVRKKCPVLVHVRCLRDPSRQAHLAISFVVGHQGRLLTNRRFQVVAAWNHTKSCVLFQWLFQFCLPFLFFSYYPCLGIKRYDCAYGMYKRENCLNKVSLSGTTS